MVAEGRRESRSPSGSATTPSGGRTSRRSHPAEESCQATHEFECPHLVAGEHRGPTRSTRHPRRRHPRGCRHAPVSGRAAPDGSSQTLGHGRYHRHMSISSHTALDTTTLMQRSPAAPALTAAASIFRGLGDVSRLAILSHLALGEHRVVELTEHLGLAQSTVSAHLRCLLGCGMVTLRAEGRASIYSLTVAPELRDVLAAAERLLAATGDAGVPCPR